MYQSLFTSLICSQKLDPKCGKLTSCVLSLVYIITPTTTSRHLPGRWPQFMTSQLWHNSQGYAIHDCGPLSFTYHRWVTLTHLNQTLSVDGIEMLGFSYNRLYTCNMESLWTTYIVLCWLYKNGQTLCCETLFIMEMVMMCCDKARISTLNYGVFLTHKNYHPIQWCICSIQS